MEKWVSATTIKDLTAASALGKRKNLPPLNENDLYQNLLKGMSRRNPDIKTLDDLKQELPEGMTLVPVLYSKVETDQNRRVLSEYGGHVRKKFLKFLAHNHADELKRMGICDHGLACMKRGLDPAKRGGGLYDVSVDHIVERSGGGRLSHNRSVDEMSSSGHKVFEVNHFSNLILLPRRVHEFKNDLNAAQGVNDIKPGQKQWVLMMVPVRSKHNPNFAYAPAKHQRDKYGLKTRSMGAGPAADHAAFMVENANMMVSNMEKAVKQLAAFLDDGEKRVSSAFNKACSASDKNIYQKFLRFYNSQHTRALRKKLEDIQTPEAVKLRSTFNRIDKKIAERDMKHNTPDDKAVPPPTMSTSENGYRKKADVVDINIARQRRNKIKQKTGWKFGV